MVPSGLSNCTSNPLPPPAVSTLKVSCHMVHPETASNSTQITAYILHRLTKMETPPILTGRFVPARFSKPPCGKQRVVISILEAVSAPNIYITAAALISLIRVCAHNICLGVQWTRIPRGNRVQFHTDYHFFCLPFFGMEVPQVRIDPTEFFHMALKTAPCFPKNGHIKS